MYNRSQTLYLKEDKYDRNIEGLVIVKLKIGWILWVKQPTMAYTNTTLHQTKVWEKKPRNGWSVVYEISPTVESRGVIVIYLNLKLNLGKNMYLKKNFRQFIYFIFY